jgi:hypothetical protein
MVAVELRGSDNFHARPHGYGVAKSKRTDVVPGSRHSQGASDVALVD